MIVVDVNVVAYLYLPGPHTATAESLLLNDADWAVPRLWQSEFRNILATYMRQGMLSLEQAIDIHQSAQDLLADNEYDVSPLQVLRLSKESGCSAYDCEYVALAQHLNVRMVTADKQLLKAFPASTMSLAG